mmetsp:Transcript_462/g.1024  ORF Transcript_462/g.1024 Transcript_462/m.1024 type:complete len:749 (+) Transcript_462:196-2442(+)
MGCSASSHAGIGGVGGLYHIPDDEGDTSWSPKSVADIMREQHHPQKRSSSNTKRKSKERRGGAGASSASSSLSATTTTTTTSCATQLAHMSCRADNGNSPERQPLPPNHNHSEKVIDCVNEGRPSQSTKGGTTQPLNESITSWNNHSIIDFDTDEPGFSNRRWLVLPEHQYDMDSSHLSLPPFLGSMYWTAVSPSPSLQQHGRTIGVGIGNEEHVPSLITDSPMETSPHPNTLTRFGIQEHAHDMHHQEDMGLMKTRADAKLLLSFNFTEDWESEATSVSSSIEDQDDHSWEEGDDHDNGNELMNQYSPRTSVDISRELLDYSALDESYILGHVKSHQSPRRLFDDDDDDEDDVLMMEEEETLNVSFEVVPTTPSRQRKSNSSQARRRTNFQSILCMAPAANLSAVIEDDTPITPRETTTVTSSPPPIIPTTPSSPNVATFYGHWGSRRERHVSTLPSPNYGEPIRLRVTESGLSGGHHNNNCPSINRSGIGHTLSNQTSASSPGGDFCSYDPYFSTGKYTITLPNRRPYGNGLVMKMGWQFMILEDSRGVVLAVIKSRYTHMPSTVVYSTKARFGGQVASGHRLTRQMKGGSGYNNRKKSVAVVVDGNNDGILMEGEALYPWALISKRGRTMGDDCTVHLVNDDVGRRGNSSSSGIFHSKASFRGQHGFDRELNTHTVVSRTTASSTSSSSSTSLEEVKVPCCVIVRDPSNLDAVDITIAPGIDPLLMICYLASHSKMDVEPIMSGY